MIFFLASVSAVDPCGKTGVPVSIFDTVTLIATFDGADTYDGTCNLKATGSTKYDLSTGSDAGVDLYYYITSQDLKSAPYVDELVLVTIGCPSGKNYGFQVIDFEHNCADSQYDILDGSTAVDFTAYACPGEDDGSMTVTAKILNMFGEYGSSDIVFIASSDKIGA